MTTATPLLVCSGYSDTGPVRRTNEDAFLVDTDLRLFAVADGMGGHNAGEVASQQAIEAIGSFIRRSHGQSDDVSWPYGIEPRLSYQGNRLRTAINLANRRVFRSAEAHDEYTGMGSTVAALLFGNRSVVVGHIGDSRVYLSRGSSLTQLTKDDTWAVAMLAEDPDSDLSSVASHPMKHVLTNVLGSKEHTESHVTEHPFVTGDRWVICSDGLHGVLDEQYLQDCLANVVAEEIEAASSRLVSAALERGTKDNVTAIVVYVQEGAE